MAILRGSERSGAGRGRVPIGAACLALNLAVLLTLPGCGGCRKDADEAQTEREKKGAEERAKKKKPKPNFVVSRLATRPGDKKPDEVADALGPPYKPGHWTAATLAAKTNNFDFVGDLEIALVGRKGDSIPLEDTPFSLITSRQVSLPKGQPKYFESVLFVPAARRQALVSCQLNWGKGGRRAWEGQHRLERMPSYQYHLVVLARWPERYKYLERLDSVQPPSDEFTSDPTKPYYRVALMRADKANRQILLPSYGLLWTSIAGVLWDDAEPDCLSFDQQQALLDWLHWGGQLILSGPDTLDTLRDSFLGTYLPASASGVRELDKSDLQALDDWSGKSTLKYFKSDGKWTGVVLKKRPGARFIPGSGDLFVERRVGRGRIVVSASRLSSSALKSWRPGWDEVFNAFLLRRQARKFIPNQQLGLGMSWADAPLLRRLDAGRISNLRYFTRDTGVKFEDYGADTIRTESELVWAGVDEESSPGPGVAAWNDSGPLAQAARMALKHAAGIEIPDRSFVLWIVAGYLLVLVPGNWAVFRLLGRVEWAWIAAPLIAVLCTVFVIRAAQLDIGFARSRTEIELVEIQPDYPRAHLTRYIALYTSLTTEYDFHFDEPGALVQPFPKATGAGRFSDDRRVVYRRGTRAGLQDYFVRSNSTGMVHSEQMIDLGGSLSLKKTAGGRFQVVNRTELTLHAAGVVYRDEERNVQFAWIGLVEPGETEPLRFTPVSFASSGQPKEPLGPEDEGGLALCARHPQPGELDLGSLVQWAQGIRELLPESGRVGTSFEQGFSDLAPGQMRLIAALKEEIKEEIPALEIRPAAPQAQVAGLVVAHLRYDYGEDPQPDVNVRRSP